MSGTDCNGRTSTARAASMWCSSRTDRQAALFSSVVGLMRGK